jgi:small GTP-binding protein
MNVNYAKVSSQTGISLQHSLRPGDEIFDFKWSPDGGLIASTSSKGVINIWDVESGGLYRNLFSRSFTAHGSEAKSSVAWSPDSKTLALAFHGENIQFWDVETGKLARKLELGIARSGHILSMAWSPDGQNVALACKNATTQILNLPTGKLRWILEGHYRAVMDVSWSPDGELLASASRDKTVKIWEMKSGSPLFDIGGNLHEIMNVAWSPSGEELALSTGMRGESGDYSTMIFDLRTRKEKFVLNGHEYPAANNSFSPDGLFLASRSIDGVTRLWRCDTWELLTTLTEPLPEESKTSATFSPKTYWLATLLAIPDRYREVPGRDERAIHVWRLEPKLLLSNQTDYYHLRGTRPSLSEQPIVTATAPADFSLHYSNAKVVLVGDSGVGKTALGLVLTEHPFISPEATHGRYVWLFNSSEHQTGETSIEVREILLWDLAGQPGYRVFHRQHLNDVAVGLVLFDSKSETDPFAGVAYWARALDEATRGFPLSKFLVASKIDRGGPPVSDRRIKEFLETYRFDRFLKTSAKRGDGVKDLTNAIHEAIDWGQMPRISTPKLFNSIKTFVINEKKEGRVLQNRKDLIRRYRASHLGDKTEDESFDVCFKQVEAAGFIKRLTFGDLILLQPEMIDSYCAWLALAAREEPDGLGSILEREARTGDFPMDEDRPLKGQVEEGLLITATVEDIVGRGIALRQPTEHGEMLVFPSELKTDIPHYPGEYVRAMAFQFEGSVKAIYATLAVCLSHTTAFKKKGFFRDAAIFMSISKEICGFAVDYPQANNDSLGRLVVFFGEVVSRETKLTFLRYVNRQLEEMAFEGSVKRTRVYQCPCQYVIPDDAIAQRTASGKTTVLCPIDERRIPIDDLAEQSTKYDVAVEEQRELTYEALQRQKRLTVVEERERRAEFHVFLCHNSQDKPDVRVLARKLREQGILPWVDEQGILAGQFVPQLEKIIDEAPAVLIIVGPNWLGRWQQQEYYAFIQRYVEHREGKGNRLTLIPVLLPGAPSVPELPTFIRGFNWIDFRQQGGIENREQMHRLVRNILEF